MINIITGEIDSGKTTALLSIYRRLGRGDGVVLPKFYLGGRCLGQRIMRLSTKETTLFSIKFPYAPDLFDERLRLGEFAFSDKGLKFAEMVLEEIIRKRINPVFIDEIGPLELMGDGFYNQLKKAVSLEGDLYISVRSRCLRDVLKLFDISSFCLLDVAGRLIQSRSIYNPF
jgi:nucleoside-triphosphatase THEP1